MNTQRKCFFASFNFLILFLIITYLPIYGQPVTDTIGKVFHRGSPFDLNDKVIPVTKDIVAMGEKVMLKKGGWELYSPSIFFIIDNSASMYGDDAGCCRRDFLGNRFTVTQEIIKTLAADSMFRGVEIGLALFGNNLYYDNDDDPLVVDSLPDSLNTGESKQPTQWLQSGGYLPLYKLGQEYETKNGKKKGSDILIEYLEVEKTSEGWTLPVKPKDYTGGRNTNISIGFRAAVNAMKASQAPKEDQYIIYISDGERTHGWEDYKEGYIMDVDYSDKHLIPTTFTIFFETKKGVHHPDLDLMNENIKNNGYSESNAKYTNLWDYNNNTKEDLYNFVNDSIISVIIKKKIWESLAVEAINANAPYNSQKEEFILPSVIPLNGRTTPLTYNIHFEFDTADTQTRSSTRSSSVEILPVNFKVDIDGNLSELDSMFYALHWIRTLGFYNHNGKGLDIVEGEINECLLKFSNNPFTAKYEYKNNIEIEVRSERGEDIEVYKLNRDDSQKFSLKIKPKKVQSNSNVNKNNGTIEYRSNDKLYATFRNSENPKLVLDTLVATVSLKKLLEMVKGIYFDNNANGRIDSIFVEMLEVYDFTDDDLEQIKENIQLPDHRKFTVKKINRHENGVSFNVSQNSPVNTAVTDADKLVLKNSVELSKGLIYKGEAKIEDAVAPVIMRAQLVDYLNPEEKDQLTITFSEKVEEITKEQPFIFYSDKKKKKYKATLQLKKQGDEMAVFTILSLSDGEKRIRPEDLININKDGEVFDRVNNRQDNPENIRREIEIEWIPTTYDVKVRSTLKTPADQYMRIQVRPADLEFATKFDSLSAVFDIFDAVGNIVQRGLKMKFYRKNENMYLQYKWNCRNIVERAVGRGTYLGLFHITSYFVEKDGDILTREDYEKIEYLAVQD